IFQRQRHRMHQGFLPSALILIGVAVQNVEIESLDAFPKCGHFRGHGCHLDLRGVKLTRHGGKSTCQSVGSKQHRRYFLLTEGWGVTRGLASSEHLEYSSAGCVTARKLNRCQRKRTSRNLGGAMLAFLESINCETVTTLTRVGALLVLEA